MVEIDNKNISYLSGRDPNLNEYMENTEIINESALKVSITYLDM